VYNELCTMLEKLRTLEELTRGAIEAIRRLEKIALEVAKTKEEK